MRITFDLSGPEFSGKGEPRVWPHTAPEFRRQLEKLNLSEPWAEMWNGLLENYAGASKCPHCVHEAFMRKDRGYITLIFAGTLPDGRPVIRGLLYECRFIYERKNHYYYP